MANNAAVSQLSETPGPQELVFMQFLTESFLFSSHTTAESYSW